MGFIANDMLNAQAHGTIWTLNCDKEFLPIHITN